MHLLSAIILEAICFIAHTSAVPGKEWAIEERAVCNADNVLRALQAPANSVTASQFCYSLILQGVPTTTLVKPAGVTPPPVIVTTTSTITRSVYPNGLTLEELPYPTFVSQYPAPRVSSGCSCLLGPKPTTTRTATGPTDTSTALSTLTTTLSGDCATHIEYPGAYSFVPSSTNQIASTTAVGLSNAYNCCFQCLNTVFGACLAYYNVPGVSCVLLVANIFPKDNCRVVAGTAGVKVATSSVPNNLGGKGPCGVSIAVTAT
ncbi:MAG: hypothetical protein HETSPECPRED_002507 [Heterodermia speciosa]|uniref:Apple domain-containing protein n=1 Tax=Heterodermia speciosa TaxID=116794 RepID=A0A8H3F1I6_9LECA|nr:MAG: hypothetical protein HETSPECPRED_002507 [Heterodermia speciosa]